MVEVIIEKPMLDMWTKSYKQILSTIPGEHTGLVPVGIVTKYFFDYTSDDMDDTSLTRSYHWKSRDYKSLRKKVTNLLGTEFVSLIEPKLVMLCEKK